MVQYSRDRLDAVFGALADPTRRAVLMALRRGDRSVGELARPFGMSLPGFIKHVGILVDAGLIERRKTGRVVTCHLKDGAMNSALDWLERHEEFWNARLDRLGAFLDQQENETWKPSPTRKPASRSGAATKRPSPPSTRRSSTPKK
ncbi:MAG TPA: metalloregulator ArsR/SmtB family transcription factor [Casimicrobiaceae bacterium]|nr:metalloregulator ArsR/SmtB family transcription factor [Casimicrobiaceae bacterium]